LQIASKNTKQSEMKQTILVTGASSGFGLLIANKLHQSGYTVLGTSRNLKSMQQSFLQMIIRPDSEQSINTFLKEFLRKCQLDVILTMQAFSFRHCRKTPLIRQATIETNFGELSR
jgi:NAD(P)-dependent dehydrogenase (short-subunit alcohol dehydrogenase family)